MSCFGWGVVSCEVCFTQARSRSGAAATAWNRDAAPVAVNPERCSGIHSACAFMSTGALHVDGAHRPEAARLEHCSDTGPLPGARIANAEPWTTQTLLLREALTGPASSGADGPALVSDRPASRTPATRDSTRACARPRTWPASGGATVYRRVTAGLSRNARGTCRPRLRPPDAAARHRGPVGPSTSAARTRSPSPVTAAGARQTAGR